MNHYRTRDHITTIDVIIIAVLVVAVMVALATCGQAAEQSYCPICGQPLDCNDKGWMQYTIPTEAFNVTGNTNGVYIMNCDYGRDFINLYIPRVCNKCQEQYGKDVEQSIKREFDYWWQGIVRSRLEERIDREEARKQEQIRRLENEIKILKEK